MPLPSGRNAAPITDPTARPHATLKFAPRGPAELQAYFGHQHTSTTELSDPAPLLRNLARGVLEVLAGVREIEQLARWMTEDVYRTVVTRANLAARARSARGVPAVRTQHTIVSLRQMSPADGVVEAVVIVRGPARTRAVAIRLEGIDGRWRAASLALL